MPYITTSQGTAFYTNASLRKKDVLNRNYDKDNAQLGMLAMPTGVGRVTNVLTASRTYVVRFSPSRPITISVIAFTVSTFSATDDAVDVGIFNGALTTLLVSSGSTTGKLNTSNGVKTVSITPTTVFPRSVYYAAFAAGASAAPATVEMTQFGTSSSVSLFGSTAGLFEQGFQAAFPLAAPFTNAGIIGNCPIMALRES